MRLRSAMPGVTRLSIGAQSFDRCGAARAGQAPHAGGHRGDGRAARGPRASRRSASTCCTTSPGARCGRGRARSMPRLRLEPDHLSLYALTLDDPDAEGLTGPGGDHLPVRPGRAPLAGRGRGPARTTTAPPRCTSSPTGGWRPRATTGTRSATGPGPGTRAGTTSPTGSGLPYEAVGPGAHAFDGATRRWNAARLETYLGCTPPARR